MMRVVILLCALLFAGCGGSLDPPGATRGFCFTLTSDDEVTHVFRPCDYYDAESDYCEARLLDDVVTAEGPTTTCRDCLVAEFNLELLERQCAQFDP